MKIVYIFIIISIIVTVDITFASEKDVHHGCQLKTGYDEAKPFHFLNEKGLVVGIDADILREVLDIIGCQLKFHELPWARTLLFVENGTIDIAIGAGFTEKRAQSVYYSVPYKFINHWLYTQADKHINVNSIDTFFKKNLKLGVVIGWKYPVEIRNALDNPEYANLIIKVAKFSQLPKMLNLDRVDGIIAIPEQLRTEILRNEFSHQFVSRAHYKEELHFMFSKKSVSPEIVTDFNNTLYQLIYNGHRKEILLKYKPN